MNEKCMVSLYNRFSILHDFDDWFEMAVKNSRFHLAQRRGYGIKDAMAYADRIDGINDKA